MPVLLSGNSSGGCCCCCSDWQLHCRINETPVRLITLPKCPSKLSASTWASTTKPEALAQCQVQVNHRCDAPMLPRRAQVVSSLGLTALLLLLVLILSPTICFAGASTEQIIFQEVIEGEVEAENFAYYIVDSNEDIILNLTSLAGDCDLYVSQARRPGDNPPNPTTETHSYDLQSTTCGEDVIAIRREVVRPFCIGIYAHPSYHLCMYRLEITGTKAHHLNEEQDTQHEYDFERLRDISEPGYDVPSHEAAKQQPHHQSHKRSASREKSSDFDSFLELLLNITIQCLGFLFEIIL